MAEWPDVDPATIAPLKDGKPDLYNYLPTRFVTKAESEARGWTHFYQGDVCRYGHIAPRWTRSPRMCVDCHRVRDGRLPIGAKGEKEYTRPVKPYTQRAKTTEAPGTAITVRPLEPDALEKKFLTEYANTRSFAKAAENCGRQEAEFLGRLSYSKVFREAVNQLEVDNSLARTLSLNEDFEWTDDKRVTLIRMYINTGDLAKAMMAIGVTNFHYEQEMQDNPEFRNAMERAEEIANRYIERIGIGRAIDGDSRLLQKVMAAKNPDYGDRMKVDMSVTQKLTDEQINTRLIQIFEQCGGTITTSPTVVDAEFTRVVEARKAPHAGLIGDSSSPQAAKSNLDLV